MFDIIASSSRLSLNIRIVNFSVSSFISSPTSRLATHDRYSGKKYQKTKPNPVYLLNKSLTINRGPPVLYTTVTLNSLLRTKNKVL